MNSSVLLRLDAPAWHNSFSDTHRDLLLPDVAGKRPNLELYVLDIASTFCVKSMSWSYPPFLLYCWFSLLQRVLAYAVAGFLSEHTELAPNFLLSKTMTPFLLLGQKYLLNKLLYVLVLQNLLCSLPNLPEVLQEQKY